VLLAVLRPKTKLGKEGYGRAVLKEVQLRLEREVSAGAVYATLNRLEEKGLLRSELRDGGEARGGLPKRHYIVEPDGIQAMNEAAAVVERIWAGVRTPLRGNS